MKGVQRTLFLFSFAMAALSAQPIDFVKTIEPILAAKCYGCHDPSKQLSGLRLDDRTTALAGGYGGKVILPGSSNDSLLVQRITGAKGLPVEQVALIKTWIRTPLL